VAEIHAIQNNQISIRLSLSQLLPLIQRPLGQSKWIEVI
jgi:hypothetical protein